MSRSIPFLHDAIRRTTDGLREQLRHFESQRPLQDQVPVSSGCMALDRLLPSHGFTRGSLVECLESPGVESPGVESPGVESPGISPVQANRDVAEIGAGGAGMFALILARQAALDGGVVVILDHLPHDHLPHRQAFYPPAAALLGLDLERLIVVRTDQVRDQLWAVDQSLRCPAVAAVWARLDRLSSHDFRRLQLAAESGGGLGLLVRSSRVRRQSSWSDIQLLLKPLSRAQQSPSASNRSASTSSAGGRRLRVELTRCRHGTKGGVVEIEIHEATGMMHEVTGMHEATVSQRAAQGRRRRLSG